MRPDILTPALIRGQYAAAAGGADASDDTKAAPSGRESAAWCGPRSSGLPEREREILRLRYGLVSGQPMTLEEIAGRFGLSRERVRQIEAKALGRLRTIQDEDALEI